MDEFHNLLREWETYYLLTGTAGATLAGLLFVSINLGERFTKRRLPLMRAHIDPALLGFVLNVVLSTLFLMPSLTRPWFGAALLVAGLLGLIYMALILRQLTVAQVLHVWDLSDWAWYAVAPLLGGLLLLSSGWLGLAGQAHAALNLTAITVLLLLVMGVRNAWDMVTYALAGAPDQREGRAADHEPPPSAATAHDD